MRQNKGANRNMLWNIVGNMFWNIVRNMLWSMVGTWKTSWKLIENLMGTHWEQEKSKQPPNPIPPPTQIDKIVYWVHAAIPHWLSKISIPNHIPHLIWPKGMNFGWGGGEIVWWNLSLWWTWTYPGNLLTMVENPKVFGLLFKHYKSTILRLN